MRYYDKSGEPISEDRFWELKDDETYYRVGLDVVNGVEVSTVWLGVDAHPWLDGRSHFETSHPEGEWHYATLEAAESGHRKAVAMFLRPALR